MYASQNLSALLDDVIDLENLYENNPVGKETTLLNVFDPSMAETVKTSEDGRVKFFEEGRRNLNREENLKAIGYVLAGGGWDCDDPLQSMVFDSVTEQISELQVFVKDAIAWLS